MNEEKGEALVRAANTEDVVALQDQLGQGVPVDSRNKTGWTPLMAVANKGNLELVQLLAERGADEASAASPGPAWDWRTCASICR